MDITDYKNELNLKNVVCAIVYVNNLLLLKAYP